MNKYTIGQDYGVSVGKYGITALSAADSLNTTKVGADVIAPDNLTLKQSMSPELIAKIDQQTKRAEAYVEAAGAELAGLISQVDGGIIMAEEQLKRSVTAVDEVTGKVKTALLVAKISANKLADDLQVIKSEWMDKMRRKHDIKQASDATTPDQPAHPLILKHEKGVTVVDSAAFPSAPISPALLLPNSNR